MKKSDYIGGAYDKCLRCEFLGKGCDGPRTNSMTLQRWCEWCYSLKVQRNLTNAWIAEKSGVSATTVERIMAGTLSGDIMRYTVAAIEDALVGSSGLYPCSLAIDDHQTIHKELELKNAELDGLRKALESIHASYKEELDIIRNESQKKIDYLILENNRKDKIIEKLLK